MLVEENLPRNAEGKVIPTCHLCSQTFTTRQGVKKHLGNQVCIRQKHGDRRALIVAAVAGDSTDSDSSSDTPYNQASAASNLGANTGYMDTSTSSSDTQLDVASSTSSDTPPSKHAREQPWHSSATHGYKYTNCSSSSDSDNFTNNKSQKVSNKGTTLSFNLNANSCSYTSDTDSSTDSESSTRDDNCEKRTLGKPNKAFEQSRKCNKNQGVTSVNKQLDMSFSSISFTSSDSLFD